MKKRIEWIDTAKGIGIILTVFAHAGRTVFSPYIYSFHMPLFFFLSGTLFSEEDDFVRFLIKKIKSLLFPYFSYAFLIFVFSIIVKKLGYISFNSTNYIYGIFWQKRFLSLWFLTVLFWLNMILYILVKIENKCKMQILAIVIFMLILGLHWYKQGNEALFWNFDMTFVAMPFFYFGHLLKVNKYNLQIFTSNITKSKEMVIGILFLMLGLSINWINCKLSGAYLDMFYHSYAIEPLTYLSAFLSIFGICTLSKLIHNKIVEFLGANSMIFFALHQSVSMVVFQILLYKLPFNLDVLQTNPYLYCSAVTIFTFVSIIPLDYIFRKNAITRLLFGIRT